MEADEKAIWIARRLLGFIALRELLKFEKGKRSSVKWIRDTPTASHQWHELKVHIAGATVEGYLDGKRYLEHTLPEPVSGRIGLWSKADSHVYFDAFTVTPAD